MGVQHAGMAPFCPPPENYPLHPPATSGTVHKKIDKENSWPHPASDDGWMHSHNALRLDMEDWSAALRRLSSKVQSGGSLASWEFNHMKEAWAVFNKLVVEHHDHEELILFPAMKYRVTLPPKLAKDHATLMQLMNTCKPLINELNPSNCTSSKMQELCDAFEALQLHMRAHLEEEEMVGLPLLRQNWTPQEYGVIEKRLLKESSKELMGWFLRPMVNDKERMRWMTCTAKIPWIVAKFILLPKVRTYKRGKGRYLEELKNGGAYMVM